MNELAPASEPVVSPAPAAEAVIAPPPAPSPEPVIAPPPAPTSVSELEPSTEPTGPPPDRAFARSLVPGPLEPAPESIPDWRSVPQMFGQQTTVAPPPAPTSAPNPSIFGRRLPSTKAVKLANLLQQYPLEQRRAILARLRKPLAPSATVPSSTSASPPTIPATVESIAELNRQYAELTKDNRIAELDRQLEEELGGLTEEELRELKDIEKESQTQALLAEGPRKLTRKTTRKNFGGKLRKRTLKKRRGLNKRNVRGSRRS
jgi:hypothetical protein